MASPGKFSPRLNKYGKMNLLVVMIILSLLLIVFIWHQRRLDQIEREMGKQVTVIELLTEGSPLFYH